MNEKHSLFKNVIVEKKIHDFNNSCLNKET